MESPFLNANRAWLQSKFGDTLITLDKDILPQWFTVHQNPPEELYHYTTIKGLLGILGTKCLWATHTAYLNDASELSHAHQLIQIELDAALLGVENKIVRDFLMRAKRAIDPSDGEYYIVSFCKPGDLPPGDLLSQWRCYSDFGGGYAIGFETRWLHNIIRPIQGKMTLRRVIYDHDLQRQFISTTIKKTSELLKELSKEMEVATANSMIATFVSFLRDHFADFHFSFKNQAFAEENEWRLVFVVNTANRDQLLQSLKFRVAQGGFIPYVELEFHIAAGSFMGQLPISRVIYGPTLQRDWAEQSLRLLLRQTGYHHVAIVPSIVPIRL